MYIFIYIDILMYTYIYKNTHTYRCRYGCTYRCTERSDIFVASSLRLTHIVHLKSVVPIRITPEILSTG